MMLYYARSLQFEDKPDYLYLKNSLMKTLTEGTQKCEATFDWVLINVSSPGTINLIAEQEGTIKFDRHESLREVRRR